MGYLISAASCGIATYAALGFGLSPGQAITVVIIANIGGLISGALLLK